jgi:hypothetical protein
MNALTRSSLLPGVLLGAPPVDQPSLEFLSEDVQRYVWNSAYGPMLIEVREGAAYVNGKRVTSIQELRTADGLGGGTPTA